MAEVLTPVRPGPFRDEAFPSPSGDSGGFGGRSGDGGGGQRPDGPGQGADAVQKYKLGVWIASGGIVMFFAALTSAMVVRKGLSDDWRSLDLPGILWASTAVLLLSSFTFEKARLAAREDHASMMRKWLTATSLLGALFLVTQFLGWQALASGGIYLATNPSSSFFYVLTAAHGVHLLGGVAALSYVVLRAMRRKVWPARNAAVEATTVYWHFMDALWVYLFVLLMVWR
jgi:cytochrome c oxidase subunit 3